MYKEGIAVDNYELNHLSTTVEIINHAKSIVVIRRGKDAAHRNITKT